ncbi:type II secretion system minor pseudopilin GspK [Marinomonas mediterranea]|uniref:type II secretion system minor pseudopilin GspK n=1 Tax=Marinomonas mediterranea TaxID=119864 RepID=UPI002349CC2E|nr:type II secretion system minor pseudopilin GspK [Marinomonas mediterranea]WCN08328.1 type II secretion system minor pseudopilin GspK [Marinomonas mediterranea]
MNGPSNKRGVALILALMVFALISGIAVKVLSYIDEESALYEKINDDNTDKEILYGGEAWAAQWFSELSFSSTSSSSQNQPSQSRLLADEFLELDDENQKLHITLVDMQSCINVNALADNELREVTYTRLKSLAGQIGTDSNWIDWLTDWVDEDQSLTGSDGREDEHYLGRSVSHRTADVAFVGDTEWTQLGLDDDVLEKIAPYVCALPKYNGLNINRASSVLLKAMLPDLTTDAFSKLEARVQSAGYEEINDFLQDEAYEAQELEEADWRTDTQFIEAFIVLEEKDKPNRFLHTLLYKNEDGIISVYYRSFAPFETLSKKLLQYLGVTATKTN